MSEQGKKKERENEFPPSLAHVLRCVCVCARAIATQRGPSGAST